MSDYFIALNTASGDLGPTGMGPDGAAALQERDLPAGWQILVVPQEAIFGVNGVDADAVLAALKERQSAAVYAKRDALIVGGCPLPGVGVMPTDNNDKIKITGAVLMAVCSKVGAGTFEAIDWTLADGSKTTFNADETIAMGMAVGQREQACHKQEQDLNAAIAAATTILAVLAVDIASGWPV